MSDALLNVDRVAFVILWASAALALLTLAAVAVERTAFALGERARLRFHHHYQPLIRGALDGDEDARRRLVASPARHRIALARLLIEPLIADRNPERIAQTRAIAQAMSLIPLADRYMASVWWWRRALALRALGLTQVTDRTPAIVGALDDANPHVRGAALDALTDLRDPASLPAVVARLHDPSLHHGRRAAALTAFGPESEPFLLELAGVDAEHRLNYARALAVCGSERARPTLAGWTRDARPEVCAAAFEALARIGLDDATARVAIDALDSADERVREMAAFALQGWTRTTDAVLCLTQHLDDTWPVAIRAARSLRSMGPDGVSALRTNATRPDLAGVLARQMLWEAV